jgi:hypothetical protein
VLQTPYLAIVQRGAALQLGSSHIGHSGSAHPAESERRHMLVDTYSKRSYKAMVYIYISHGR